jgi:hypothetical protein
MNARIRSIAKENTNRHSKEVKRRGGYRNSSQFDKTLPGEGLK